MLRHGDLKRGNVADSRVDDARGDGAVDQADRQVPKEIDDARMCRWLARSEELVEQPLDLGPHALERADGGEEGS
jgi:hypothetical protein